MDHSEDNLQIQEAPAMEAHADLAPVAPSISENTAVRGLIFNHALEAEDRTEGYNQYNDYRHTPFMEHRYSPTMDGMMSPSSS